MGVDLFLHGIEEARPGVRLERGHQLMRFIGSAFRTGQGVRGFLHLQEGLKLELAFAAFKIVEWHKSPSKLL